MGRGGEMKYLILLLMFFMGCSNSQDRVDNIYCIEKPNTGKGMCGFFTKDNREFYVEVIPVEKFKENNYKF